MKTPFCPDFGPQSRVWKPLPRRHNELLPKACGVKLHHVQTNGNLESSQAFFRIFDATPGFLSDALILTRLGCEVLALEVSTKIHTQVQRSLEHFRKAQDLSTDQRASLSRLFYESGDSLAFLSGLGRGESPEGMFSKAKLNFPNHTGLSTEFWVDAVYADPFFAREGRTALPKKEMQTLWDWSLEEAMPPQEITDWVQAGVTLVQQRITRRFVLKRPIKESTDYPGVRRPDLLVKGKMIRFDCWIAR